MDCIYMRDNWNSQVKTDQVEGTAEGEAKGHVSEDTYITQYYCIEEEAKWKGKSQDDLSRH